jgi:hypothetical protein
MTCAAPSPSGWCAMGGPRTTTSVGDRVVCAKPREPSRERGASVSLLHTLLARRRGRRSFAIPNGFESNARVPERNGAGSHARRSRDDPVAAVLRVSALRARLTTAGPASRRSPKIRGLGRADRPDLASLAPAARTASFSPTCFAGCWAGTRGASRRLPSAEPRNGFPGGQGGQMEGHVERVADL